MAEPVPLKYRGFISYSHRDTTWAKWLQRGLEGFKIDKDLAGRETARGAIPESLRPIFRDREDFVAGDTLSEQTLEALDASQALIVICSPASAKSHYVNEEIRLFESRHPDRQIIPLIIDGTPDDPEDECFPSALKFKVSASGEITTESDQPLGADVRDEGDGKDLALAKVIAGLLGLSSDDVFRRAERERRATLRRKRGIQISIGVLAFLLVAAGVGWSKQDYLKDRYHWLAFMGPRVLTSDEERVLRPKDEFTECARGCPAMVVIPSGAFVMGSAREKEFEDPPHQVAIDKPFAVSKFEITFDDWNACVNYGDCSRRLSDGRRGHGQQPVATVEWTDAKRYAAWLSRMTGKTYRLLSEAEWEYAARAGTQSAYPWGDEVGNGNANCTDCGSQFDFAAPTGSFAPNAFGLYDMNGNVSEWVEDVWHSNYKGAPSDGSARVAGFTLDDRVVRGGSFVETANEIHSASRRPSDPDNHSPFYGFRIARTLSTELGSSSVATSNRRVERGTSLNFAGVYRLTGTHPTGTYSGILAILDAGFEVALTRWTENGRAHGTAQVVGEKLVAYWSKAGPVTYSFDANGMLEGKWPDGQTTEMAHPQAFAAPKPVVLREGSYNVEGRYPSGDAYAGTVTISEQPGPYSHLAYHLSWKIGQSSYQGDGEFFGNILIVEWGASTPAVYALEKNGRLSGLYGGGRGSETVDLNLPGAR
jgi:formylglycine-generating enzyme required for sulfatase activity